MGLVGPFIARSPMAAKDRAIMFIDWQVRRARRRKSPKTPDAIDPKVL